MRQLNTNLQILPKQISYSIAEEIENNVFKE
jgi:hypothetical protein